MIKQAIILVLCLINAMPLTAQKLYSNTAARMYNEAISAYRGRHFSLAKTKFQEILSKYENDGYADIARMHLAEIFKDTKDYEKAIDIYKEILAKHTSEHEIYVARKELIEIYYNTHRYKDGIDFLESLRKIERDNDELNVKLADFYLQTGRGDEAWLLLQNLLEEHSSDVAFKKLLSISIKRAEVPKLINIIESRRVRYQPNQYVHFISNCYIALHQPTKAIEAIKSYKQLNTDFYLLQKLTQLQLNSGQYEEAIPYLEILQRLAPSEWNNIKNLGQAYFKLDKKTKALEVWKSITSRGNINRTNIINLTDVLIEHQLYEEAMQAIDNYRQTTFEPTALAVEKANILYATNRKNEAMEEYLLTFASGVYQKEAFEKLYEEKHEGFSLQKRLTELYNSRHNLAITQALVEYYFRKADLNDVNKIAKLINDAHGNIDEMFYERFCQDATITAEPFYYECIRKVIQTRQNTGLELKLAIKAMTMSKNYQSYAAALYNIAAEVSDKEAIIDLDKNAELNIKLATFALYELCDISQAQKHINKILKSDLQRAYGIHSVEGNFLKIDTQILKEEYAQAKIELDNISSTLDDLNLDLIQKEEIKTKVILKNAWLSAHQANYPEALKLLNEIINNRADSKYINDALTLALYIIKRSVGGDLETLNKSFNAERLIHNHRFKEAQAELQEIININKTNDTLISEIKADIILLQAKDNKSHDLMNEINNYLREYPTHYKAADILEHKITMLLENKTKEKEAIEAIQTFIETFRSDLRVAKYKNYIASKRDL